MDSPGLIGACIVYYRRYRSDVCDTAHVQYPKQYTSDASRSISYGRSPKVQTELQIQLLAEQAVCSTFGGRPKSRIHQILYLLTNHAFCLILK
ncbi:uncharacterized protein EAF02_003695 [Botrytis sinoallii]|uniref:uncharacterized protein n=1 Tax=Botrytis sinoallii TaxID=1463999 RepID=UPI0018FF5F27|nr:uncharacterized protein EAF02_003695 [Botrytis sinoallii]KAF7887048.1 hypothetical protein EAF02_003695 [Botrytis sinoallii]